MEKINSCINGIYRWAVAVIATVSLSILFVISLVSTCYRETNPKEITYFCKDSIVANILFLVVSFAIVVGFRRIHFWNNFKEKLEDDIYYHKLRKGILTVIFAISLVWVLMTQFIPGSDQMDVVGCAYKLHAGEYNMLDPGGYLNKWTNQAGAVVIQYLLARVWGDFNILGFQILNVVGLTLIYKTMCEIMEYTGVARSSQILTLAAGIVFFPFIMYTSFVYGTIWHVTLSLLAFYSMLKFLDDYKWWRIPLSGLYMALAIQVKNNAMIFLAAIVFYILINILKDKEALPKKIIFIFCIVIFVYTIGKIPGYMIEKKTGYKLDQGVSSWAFVAMGLQESEEEYPPGWWNGYNNQSYEASGYNTDAQSVVVKEEVKNRLLTFKKDKKYAVKFFSQKLASMWAEPTYQCFWINQIRKHRVDFPDWLDDIMSVRGYLCAANVMDYLQLWLYLGALLWLVLEPKDSFNSKSFFMLVFLGGFLFHLFWEAKTQYSITYSVLLIPCAITGIERAAYWIESRVRGYGVVFCSKIIIVLMVASTITYSIVYKWGANGSITGENASYAAYLEDWEEEYTNETPLDIGMMQGQIDYDEGMMVYLNHLLEINGIKY